MDIYLLNSYFKLVYNILFGYFIGFAYIQSASRLYNIVAIVETVTKGLYTVAEVVWLFQIFQIFIFIFIYFLSFIFCMKGIIYSCDIPATVWKGLYTVGIIYLIHVYFRIHKRVMGHMYFKVFNAKQNLLS